MALRILGKVSPVAALLLLLACSSLALNAFLYLSVTDYEGKLRQLSDLVNELQQENVALRRSLEVLEKQLAVRAPPLAEQAPLGEWVYVAGVHLEQTEHGMVPRGEIMRIYARFIPGAGRVLIATTPKIGIDLQASAETAYAVAQRMSGVNASNLDVVITVIANRTVEIVDGPSAGVAIAVLLYAELTGASLRKDVVATGTVLPDGSVGRVGGIIEKAIAAAELGAGMLLVPEGQTRALVYTEKVRQIGPVTIISYEPVVVDVEEYLRRMGYAIDVVEISDVRDAVRLMVAG